MKIEHRDKYMKLGLRIAYFRKMRGLTQEQLAEKLGKSAGYIGAVEAVNVERAISLDMLFDIADLLGVPAHKFLQFDDGENE
ncbi:MAG: helix-turn-helix domain-containing protein [Oscillospiraceae bacterium]